MTLARSAGLAGYVYVGWLGSRALRSPYCHAVSAASRVRWSAIGAQPLLIRPQARRWSTRGHVFERPLSSVRNPDPADIDQLGASVDDLMSYRYQPGLSQKKKHPICETEARTEVRFGAALVVDEQL
jgi:hypothetical protein